METKVKIHPYQELPSADIMAMQNYAQTSFDAVVAELLFDEGAFTFMAAVQTGPFEVTVGAGRYVVAGKVYPHLAESVHNITSLAPAVDSRIVLVVVSGQEVETETETRRFLVDAATRQTQPRPVATRLARQAVIDFVAGAPALVPSRPAVPDGRLVIAELTLDAAGIVAGPTAEEANRAWSLERVVYETALLKEAQERDEAMFDTLRSDLASISERVERFRLAEEEVERLKAEVEALKVKADGAEAATQTDADDFVDDAGSDDAFAGVTAEVDEGAIRFKPASRATKLVALSIPGDPKVDKSASGLVIPAWTSIVRAANKDRDSELTIAASGDGAPSITFGVVKMSHFVHAVDEPLVFKGDPSKLKKGSVKVWNPETDLYQTIDAADAEWVRVPARKGGNIWRLKPSEPYWAVGFEEITIVGGGARVAQTFLCSQGGWFTGFDFGFTKVGPADPVWMLLCETSVGGQPRLNRVLAHTTVSAANLKTWPKWTAFDVEPVWLRAGRRYAVVLVTQGSHRVAVSNSNTIHNGRLFTWGNGRWDQETLDRDLCMRQRAAKFAKTRVVVDIDDIALGAGIRTLKAGVTGHEPAGTDLVIEARVPGGVWTPLDGSETAFLAGAPTQVSLRLVFSGTQHRMPGIRLTKSRIVAAHPPATVVHVSAVRALASGTTSQIRIVQEAAAFTGAPDHTWGAEVLTGAAYGTATTDATPTTETLPDGRTRRTWDVTLGGAVSTYRVRTTMTTANPGSTFAVEHSKSIAL